MGNALRYTDDRGNVTVNTYDERGNRISFRDGASLPGASTVMPTTASSTCHERHRRAREHLTKYELDAKGNVHVITTPDGASGRTRTTRRE